MGLGALTKGFPIVIAPVALAWLWGQGDRRGTARGVAGLATTLALVGAGWLALSPAGALDTLAYQLDRPVQIESAQASVLFLFDALGGPPPEVFSSHGSAALDHPVGAPVEVLFASGLGGLVALLSWGAARAARHVGGAGRPNGAGYSDPGAARALVLAALGAVAVFVAFGRVLSPQYLIWVIPLLALAVAWGLRILSALLVASCALTLAEFPSRYVDLVELDSVAVTITMARNVALLGAAAAVTVAVWRSAGAAVAGSPAEPLTAGAGGAARSIVPSRPAPRR